MMSKLNLFSRKDHMDYLPAITALNARALNLLFDECEGEWMNDMEIDEKRRLRLSMYS